MTSLQAASAPAVRALEIAKLGAFIRRDLLVAWSYRMAFVSDGFALLSQALLFSYVAKLVDPDVVPSFGGTRTSYMAYVAIGIALTSFLQVGLSRMASVIRSEQMAGTLETLLLSPTRLSTLQLGSVAYDLIYVPLQSAAFLVIVALSFGVDFNLAGIGPAAVLLLVFFPFTWGLGIAGAAGILTFRRGGGLFGIGGYALTLLSGAYFPLELFPVWVQTIARANPIAVGLHALRSVLLGSAGWVDVAPAIASLAVASAVSLVIGTAVFRAALRRELRKGTLGLY